MVDLFERLTETAFNSVYSEEPLTSADVCSFIAAKGDLKLIEACVEHGYEITDDILFSAINHNRLNIVEWYMSTRSITFTARLQTILFALKLNRLEILKLLINDSDILPGTIMKLTKVCMEKDLVPAFHILSEKFIQISIESFDDQLLSLAIINDDRLILDCIASESFTNNIYTVNYLIESDCINLISWLVDHKRFPVSDYYFFSINRCNRIEIFKIIIDCYCFDDNMINRASKCFIINIDFLKILHEKNIKLNWSFIFSTLACQIEQIETSLMQYKLSLDIILWMKKEKLHITEH